MARNLWRCGGGAGRVGATRIAFGDVIAVGRRMTFPTKYTYTGERRSVSRERAVLADIAAGKLSAPGACQLLGITLDELHGRRTVLDAYGREGLRTTHRNIIANRIRKFRGRCRAGTAMPRASWSAAGSSHSAAT